MRTTIDIFDANHNAIGELTVGTDIVRGEDALDRDAIYFCADMFTDSDTSDSVHIDVNLELSLLQQHYLQINQRSFTLPIIGDVEADEPFTVNEDNTSFTIARGMAQLAGMTVLAYPALFEGGLTLRPEPFEVLVSTKELHACLVGLFAAQ